MSAAISHNDDKERICARAAALVEPDSFVYIDSGSTTLKLIEHLPRLEGVTYVTDSVLHAQHLALRGMRTVVLGGELKPETEALVGPDALATLDRYNFNCGFWGSNGIAAEQGLTTPDIEEAQVKRISMRHTAKRFVISDASKFGMVAPVKFADFRDATIITTGEVPPSTSRWTTSSRSSDRARSKPFRFLNRKAATPSMGDAAFVVCRFV